MARLCVLAALSPAAVKGGAATIRSWRGRENCNDFSIGVELEGLEGQLFEAAQYAALASIARGIARRYPIEAVAGHEHVAPGRKADPGAGFEWSRLRELLSGIGLADWDFPDSAT